jgi:hypothetical protein
MRGAVVRAAIGFDLDDPSRRHVAAAAVDDGLPEQRFRDP